MRIVVGITGGIAAYKAVSLVRLLVESGHDVKVIPTQNALRFVGAATLEAISHNTVDPDLYTDVADVKHIELGQSADLVIVAPATASFLARTAAGIADDLLSNVLLATKAPVVIAPAMHTEMWQNAATKRNVQQLELDGYILVEPEVGRLTGGDSGQGRLAEPQTIARRALAACAQGDLVGKKIVVTAGGTREPIDPVRFIGNSSSGKQGVEIALAAQRRGAEVILIAANLAEVQGLKTIHADTVKDMSAALEIELDGADALIMAAAVSDYRVEAPSQVKIKKNAIGEKLTLTLIENQDLLATLAAKWGASESRPLFVGFAAETEPDETALEAIGKAKLLRKHCDVIVANDVSGGKVFGSSKNTALIIQPGSPTVRIEASKAQVAEGILEVVTKRLDLHKAR